LPVIRPAHLDAGYLGQRVRPVGGLERTSQQILFFDWLRAKLGVDAGRAEKEQAVDIGAVGGVNDVSLNDQVFADEVRGIEIVGENSTDFGRGQDDVIGAFAFEEGAYGHAIGEVELGV
jgi:hypothetical protein